MDGSPAGTLGRRAPSPLDPSLKADHPLSDSPSPSSPSDTPSAEGTFAEDGTYTPRQVTADDLGMSFADAIAGTLVDVEDGQIVQGTVVKVDKDEVLLDIGYKSEGVIPARELSIRNDIDPHEVVSLGDSVEAPLAVADLEVGVESGDGQAAARPQGSAHPVEHRGVVAGPEYQAEGALAQ